ncbi:hypothetical protein [Streptomyces sp. NPDC004726]
MSVVLAELGRQVAGRWATVLLLPGAFYICAAVVAAVLGHGHALDPGPLRTWLDSVAAAPAGGRAGSVLIAAVAFTAASAAAGMAASAGELLVERLWSASGREPLLRRFTSARRRRWERAEAQVRTALAEFAASGGAPGAAEVLRTAIARRDADCTVPADRPTWAGDRLNAVDQRIHDRYRLDLSAAWPRLWLVLPETVRPELVAAQTACASAARLVGWGLLYLALAVFWWPAALLAAAVLLAARHRTRLAIGVYADLVESSVDMFGRDLVLQLGVNCPGRLTREVGEEANSLLRKDRTDHSGA